MLLALPGERCKSSAGLVPELLLPHMDGRLGGGSGVHATGHDLHAVGPAKGSTIPHAADDSH